MKTILLVLLGLHFIGWFLWATGEGYASTETFAREGKKDHLKNSEGVSAMILCFFWEFTLVPTLIGSVIYSLTHPDTEYELAPRYKNLQNTSYRPRPPRGSGCSNCGGPFSSHCTVHTIPCCPGKCEEAADV